MSQIKPIQQTGINLKVPYGAFGSIFGMEEIEAITKVIRGEVFTIGPAIKEFEKAFADYMGVKYAFAVANCTTALHLATQLIGISPGDEVIVPPLTFIATAQPILKQGGIPVFADIDPNTFNIDPQKIEKLITKRTKAVYVVHYAGQCAEMDFILGLAQKHKLYVIEDVAHAPGAKYKGKKAGSLGDLGCFSFHAQKNISTLGEGGMITTNNEQFAQGVELLRCMGISHYKDPHEYKYFDVAYDVVDVRGQIGNNFRMNEVQSAVGLVQLKRLDALNQRRIEIGEYYNKEFSGIEGLITPSENKNCKHIYHLYCLLFNDGKIGATKREFLDILLKEEGVEAITHFLPIYLFSLFESRGYKKGLCPIAEKVYRQLVNLPLKPNLSQEQVEIVVSAVKSAIRKLKRK